MQRILLVKTSSLGDVVHNLPVAGDIRAAFPGAAIDWVVEEPLAAVPRLHPSVARVIPVALRRWRRSPLSGRTRAQFRAFARELRRERYDAVIDTQGLVKSAIIARLARGTRHGLDFRSAREPLRVFYHSVHAVPWALHAVERNRLLAARALGYAVPGGVDYGIAAALARPAWAPQRDYAVLVHSTSAAAKLWPVERWVELGAALGARGVESVLPWGAAAERARAQDIARRVPRAVVAPPLSLAEVAALLATARAVVGVDTGLTHLACALKVPTVGLYCATDPAATGLHGSARAASLGGIGVQPSVEDALSTLDGLMGRES